MPMTLADAEHQHRERLNNAPDDLPPTRQHANLTGIETGNGMQL